MKFIVWYHLDGIEEFEEVEFDNEYEAEDYAWDKFVEEAEHDNYCGVVNEQEATLIRRK